MLPRGILVAFLVIAVLVGSSCDQTSSPAERQEEDVGVEKPDKNEKQAEASQGNVPDHDVTLEEDCGQSNIPGKCCSVTTSATSKEDFRTLTAHFREENPQAMAVIISFYPPKQTADISGTGEWFANEQAARAFLGEGYTDSDIRAIMDDGGMLVISMKDTMEDMTREMCAEWDTTTMGTLPPEWNCPGY